MINDKIIVALDTQEQERFEFLVNELKGSATYLKVGMELFYSLGTDAIKTLKDNGFRIFLDLKMHDIPNTVANTTKVLAKLDVDMLNLHAAGGSEMMKRACEAYREYKEDGLMIAVTHLTSTSTNVLKDEIGIDINIDQSILNYALNAKINGLDGVVCSAQEVRAIKKAIGESFKCVTPGIRPSGHQNDDQIRVMTPAQAFEAGSDFLVIGRPITQASSPKQAYQSIIKELKGEPSS